jgi:hypothetical protein
MSRRVTHDAGMKKPTRTESRAKQKQVARLRSRSFLEPFLPEKERSKKRPIVTKMGIGIIGPEPPKQDVLAAIGKAATEFLDMQHAVLRTTAATVGPDTIYEAKRKYEEEYDRAIHDALAGIETKNLELLRRQLALWGFSLFEDSHLRKQIQEWWLGARNSNLSAARRLKAVLEALRTGRGKLGEPNLEKEREDTKARQAKHILKVEKAFEEIKKEIEKKVRIRRNNLHRKSFLNATEIQRIESEVIDEAAKSSDKPTQKAAEKAKKLQKKQGLWWRTS